MDEQWVSETSPWICYPLESWQPLIGNLKPIIYKRKTFQYHQDDAAAFTYIVKSGRIRVTAFSPDGAEKQLYIAEAGCCCGEVSCIMGLPHASSALSIVDTYVYRVSAAELISTIRDNWEINMRIFNMVFRKNIVFRNQILELSFFQSLERTASLLLNLCKQYGVEEADGWRIDIHFTHSEVASMVNASRVTVSNIFTWMLENGYLKKQGRFVVVTSLENLRQLAAGDESPQRNGPQSAPAGHYKQ